MLNFYIKLCQIHTFDIIKISMLAIQTPTPIPNKDARLPKQTLELQTQYKEQLVQLQELGFAKLRRNLKWLIKFNGDVAVVANHYVEKEEKKKLRQESKHQKKEEKQKEKKERREKKEKKNTKEDLSGLYQEQLNVLNDLDYTKVRKNVRLLKQFNGDVAQVIQFYVTKQEKKLQGEDRKYQRKIKNVDQLVEKPTEADLLGMVKQCQLLVVDCYNVCFADRKMMQKTRNRINSKRMLYRLIKKALQWIVTSNSQVKEVYLIWDYFQFDKFKKPNFEVTDSDLSDDERELNTETLKLVQNLKQVVDTKMQEELQGDKFNLVRKAELLAYKDVKFYVISSGPQYEIADDYIAEFGSKLPEQVKANTVVVTSDRGLRERLVQSNVKQFMGNGSYVKIGKKPKDVKMENEKTE